MAGQTRKTPLYSPASHDCKLCPFPDYICALSGGAFITLERQEETREKGKALLITQEEESNARM